MMPPIDHDRKSINESHNRNGPVHNHQRHGEVSQSSPSLSQSYSFADAVNLAGSFMERTTWEEDARPLLPKAAFFMGDIRDGLPMVRIQKRPRH